MTEDAPPARRAERRGRPLSARALGQLRQAAYHESAHAVTAAEFGWTIERVAIRGGRFGLGGAWLEERAHGDEFAIAVERAIVALAGDVMVLALAAEDPDSLGLRLAGPPTEAELEAALADPLREARTGYRSRTDVVRATAAVGSCCANEVERVALLTFCRSRAESLLRSPTIWAEVEALAEALVERGELSGEQVVALIEGMTSAA